VTAGHDVLVLSRRPADTPAWAFATDPARVKVAAWTPDGTAGAWTAALEGAGAVVNLAGESIGNGRWTAARKKQLYDSRMLATRSLVQAIRALSPPPAVLISASAVGYYGLTGDESLTEDSPPGTDFLARLCVDWEAEARAASPLARVVLVRGGVVFGHGGGALGPMVRPFRLFAGGPLGSGRQYLSWIHRADWIRLVVRCLSDASVDGPVNATAPTPVTNREFARAVGHVLHRPSFLPAPAFALRLILGEMADAIVLGGQRVMPARALEHGFTFRFPELGPALKDVL
jgi:uncharacterized protein (TIGR01777 family)